MAIRQLPSSPATLQTVGAAWLVMPLPGTLCPGQRAQLTAYPYQLAQESLLPLVYGSRAWEEAEVEGKETICYPSAILNLLFHGRTTPEPLAGARIDCLPSPGMAALPDSCQWRV
ncbi:hypothetical protein P7K49_009380 [Saguinus oedipus]|uniref:Uncharacterized protein n=1 Tax=Saguinus oedipus TaxID=9490 RepID=A0ABQ9VJT2_SAGOE|nr:hypothetical protein P7K49_009380 [Saguinus oedipus]